MENPVAGQPAHLIRSTYIRASESIRGGECSLAVVLINDVDTGLGSWGDTAQFTINQQTVFGELMHLVDYPNSVEGKDTLRIPVIITGNDFTKLYEPLVRAGRMTAFEWIPDLEERTEIVCSIFPELSTDDCSRLIVELQSALQGDLPDTQKVLTIAFYSHLRSSMLDDDLWKKVEHAGLEKTVDLLLVGDEPDFSKGVTYERVMHKGLELARSSALINHIRRPNHLPADT
jgi:hypothetical protein